MDATPDSITSMGGRSLARAIAAGEVTALAVVEAHIARIEAVNPALNAVVFPRFDEARQEARLVDERRARGETLPPLAGVPITVKESLDLQGTPSTFGVASRSEHRAPADDVHVARLRQAGAIVLGKTNVSQCLIYTETDNPVYGLSRNPWNPGRTCGGSSGGEAAIIAAGGSPLGLGTDIGGSVRIPAHFCGLASLKPTSGRMDDVGRFSVPVGQRSIPSQVGVFARQVDDVALGLELANGGREPEQLGQPRLGDWRGVDVKALRVAYYTDDGSFPVAPALRRAVEEAAGCLRQAGARVTPWQPPEGREVVGLYGRLITADRLAGVRRNLGKGQRSAQLRKLIRAIGTPPRLKGVLRPLLQLLKQDTLAGNLASVSAGTTDSYWQDVALQLDYQQRFAQALDQAPGGPFDIILSPPSSLPAFTHGATGDLITAGAYSVLYNLIGYPAGVVPFTRVGPEEESDRKPGLDLIQRLARKVERNSKGLPVGVQVAARPWQEHQALAVMGALEEAARARPGYPRTPVGLQDSGQ